jgi:hypothetical protein
MPLDISRARVFLQGFDFKKLFIEEMGWDHHTQNLPITVDGKHILYPPSLRSVAWWFYLQIGESRSPLSK